MSDELKVLELVSSRLEKANLQFMVTGSIAANFYSIPRMTRDIDIVVNLKKEDSEKVVDLFKDEFYLESDAIRQAIQRTDMFNLIHNETLVKVDFIIRKNHPYRELEFKRRKFKKINGFNTWVVSPEDLILSKMFWAKDSMSEFQMRDVENIMKSVKEIDWTYVEKWVKEMGLEAVYSKVKP